MHLAWLVYSTIPCLDRTFDFLGMFLANSDPPYGGKKRF